MFKPTTLVRLRNRAKMTRTEMMFALDQAGLRISRQTLVNWESGHSVPDVRDIDMLSKVLKADPAEFVN